ncbi:MAG: histidine kinase [Bacteroidota bacterium]
MKWLKTTWDKSYTNTTYRIALHAGFWLFLLFYWMQESVVIHINLQQHFSVTLVGIAFALFLFYPLVYVIVPLLQKRKWVPATLLFIIYYYMAVLLRSYHIELVVDWYNLKHTWIVGRDFWPRVYRNQFSIGGLSKIFFSSIPSLLEIIMVPLIIKFIRYAYQFNLKQAWLAQENAQLQLTTLKAQINPHFFFNTLNNLQSFIVQNEKEKSVDLLNKLADFMRSSLYDCEGEWITMKQETDLLNNYVAIERVRFDERADITINITNQDPAYRIPPFMFLPFVENAFKHGGALPTGEIAIHIELTNKADALILKSVNQYHKEDSTINPGGIGLQNVRKRLDHYFPGRHLLAIKEANGKYSVELKIDKAL